ncbi:MAG: cation:proton antiporter [Chitinophagales bacterium]|nr:cation:proton antiporter [Chitinophagales bacterium]
MQSYYVILFLCLLVMLSYVFTLISKYTRIPSVVLLLGTGIGLKYLGDSYHLALAGVNDYVQMLGTVGLIMIVLEASLDLHVTREKTSLIRNSFLSAIVILAVSVIAITLVLQFWLHESFINSLVYAIPLSIISSAIVIPSVTHLEENKKEFLIYEASFSDIIGIIIFNYFTAGEVFSLQSLFGFVGGIVAGIIISLVVSVFLIYMLTKIRINIRFFLIFSILIFLYVSGKMLHLPSLIIIMMFGLLINNWHLLRRQQLVKWSFFDNNEVEQIALLMKSLTAETAFLIRTFFFVIFGYSINVGMLFNKEVVIVGTLIVGILLLARVLLLRFFVHSSVMPEVLMLPRGLITIVLFYIIPENLRLKSFNEGILFYVVLLTSLLMMVGLMIHTTDKPKKEEEERAVFGETA